MYQQPQHYGDGQQAQRPLFPILTENPKQTRSFEVDDDNENLPFSAGIINVSISHEFCVPKIIPYIGKEDHLDHVNTYKMEISLRGATPPPEMQSFPPHLVKRGEKVPASTPVQRLHDIRQVESEPLQSYLSRFNKKMLFCERITDAEAFSALKGGLDMNLPFWRDVRKKNSTTFDQLVEMITEEITNDNMILHRNCRGVAPNQMPRMNYERG
ncbi:Uncharacterized protein Adt_07087 [Abeliophyllum distichum]|uniref:Retrotransposon gag domain-containing protein n=1 Tax=Abeliophyllum distichum TaxID=126358 RepID=A0ABD1V983_9LAMI